MFPDQLSMWVNPIQVSQGTLAKTYYMQVQEETQNYGIDNAGIKELLALLIGSKANLAFCQELASMPVARLHSLSAKELQKLGATTYVAMRLEAAFRLAKKLRSGGTQGETINSPSDAADALSFITNEEQEHLAVLLLDTKNQIKKSIVVSKGTINSSMVHAREVFKAAIRESANAIIVGHNHPSGDPTPSREDIEVTKRLSVVGETVGIQLLDHVIVGSSGYRSLKEMGIL